MIQLSKNYKCQKYYFIFIEADGEGLRYISKLFDEKKIKPSVDEIYDLNSVNEALNKVKQGKSKGKTIIKFQLRILHSTEVEAIRVRTIIFMIVN